MFFLRSKGLSCERSWSAGWHHAKNRLPHVSAATLVSSWQVAQHVAMERKSSTGLALETGSTDPITLNFGDLKPEIKLGGRLERFCF